MNFEDEEEWDLELLDKLVQSEEEAIAARRAASATPLPSSTPGHPPPLSHTLRRGAPQPPSKQDDHHSSVFDLQQRLIQAEQELSELRQKTQQNTGVATSTFGEELRRLQAEVLFKDQEILEVKRACTEKSEQIKRVKTENEELRKRFEEVKRAKRQEGLSEEIREKESAPRISKVSHAEVSVSQGTLNQDLWYPPWTPSVPLREGSKSRNLSPQDVQTQTKTLGTEDLGSVRELKTRVLHNGCTSSNEGEIKTCNNQQQQVKTLKLPTSYDIQGKGEIIKENINEKGWEHLFLGNLLNIWCPRNMKEESKGLVSKLLANCEVDMQILLPTSIGGADDNRQVRNGSKASPSDTKKNLFVDGVEGSSAAFKTSSFRSILVKVVKGLVSSWILFLAVLELSEARNIQVSESALRVLHCILTQDEGCHKHLFGRKILISQPETELLKAAGFRGFSEESACRPFNCLPGDYSPANVLNRYFFSPRISWHNKVFPQCQHNGQDVSPQENVCPQINDEVTVNERVSFEDCNQDALMARIFNGALVKAVKGCNEPIGVTAVSILVTVVTNAEPFRARDNFGFILFDGSIASLLRISAGLDVRLQAVRLVHSLLHCPPVLKKLLDMQEQSNRELAAPASKPTGELMQELEFDGRSAEENPFLQNGEDVSAQSETARAFCSAEEKSSFEVLEGLISCLSHARANNQAYILRRNALRVLTFIATSGQRGAAFLLAKETAFISARSLPVHLIALLDQELKLEEGDGGNPRTMEQTEEREYVLRETLTLLCRLASHSTQSSKLVEVLTSDKNVARQSISVINRLMSRDAQLKTLTLQGKSMASSVNVIELCLGLRRRILASISNV